MNAYCSNRDCGLIFHYEPARNGSKPGFCSAVCRNREHYRRRVDAHGPLRRKAVPKPERDCAAPKCRKAVPEARRRSAIYCSIECKTRVQSLKKKAKSRGVPYIKVKPIPVAPPPVKVKVMADPCDGCRHVRPQPASFRGVECARGVFRACNPLGIEGPKLKEAI